MSSGLRSPRSMIFECRHMSQRTVRACAEVVGQRVASRGAPGRLPSADAGDHSPCPRTQR